MALKQWLIEQEPGLAEEIFLDLDPHTGMPVGERWTEALRQASSRCEAVICLLSANWVASGSAGRIPVRGVFEKEDFHCPDRSVGP